MACVYPLDAWRSASLSESGKRGIVFNPRSGFVDQPLQVPCGRCVGCCACKALSWSVRMVHEASLHEQSSFVTLTYADAPPVISKRDLQLFFKRLRHRCDFRYFACGEYGSTTRRPHYHAVIFGQDFLAGSIAISDSLYTHPVLEEAWGQGIVSAGELTLASCMYVAGYVNKKVGDPDTFTLMSRRPGIGHDWLDRFSDDLRRTGVVVIDGQEFAVPPRYMAWKEDELSDLKLERQRYIDSLSAEQRWQRRVSQRSRELNLKGKLAIKGETL